MVELLIPWDPPPLAGVMVVLRKRWIRMELMMGVESDRHGPATGRRGRYARRKIGSYEVEGELDETLGPLGVPFWGVLSRLRIRQLGRGEKTDDRRLPGH